VVGGRSAIESALRRVSYNLEIRPDALADIAESATWYEEREEGLGLEFVRAIRTAISRLQSNPLAHRMRSRRRIALVPAITFSL
jgi:plasmid stabilization system protein ParE